MLAQPLRTWLQGNRDYNVGVILFNTYGKDDALKKALASGSSAHNQARLLQAIQAIVEVPASLPVYTPPADHQGEMPDSADSVLQAFRDQWLPLYKQMTYLQGQLDRYGPENSADAKAFRHTTALEILELEQRINKIWQQRAAYAKTGDLVADQPADDIPTDPLELAKLIGKTQRYIRRYKQWIKERPADKNRVKWDIKLRELEALLKTLTHGNSEI